MFSLSRITMRTQYKLLKMNSGGVRGRFSPSPITKKKLDSSL